MTLITDSKDERLEFDTLCPQCGPRPLLDEDGACASCGADAQGPGADEVMQSLRAALAERDALHEAYTIQLKAKEAAEALLCRARDRVIDALNRNQAPMPACQEVVDALMKDSAPCRHESEIKEGDYWKERARESFANGTCPCCFCTDEGPHEKGCAWAEHEEEAKRLREELQCVNECAVLLQRQVAELRRRTKEG